MKNEEQHGALETPAEANRDKHVNYFAEEEDTDSSDNERIEDRDRRLDADSGNDGSFNELLADEKQIDPGNEHHHSTEAVDKISDDIIDRSRCLMPMPVAVEQVLRVPSRKNKAWCAW